VHRIASWWDEFELWIVGLPFIPQFILVLAILIPVALGIAWTFDRLLDGLLKLAGRNSDR
jgi:uncharacterized membrane protein